MKPDHINHHNRHRDGKVSFQVFLTPEEAGLVATAKAVLGVSNNRELLVRLCSRAGQLDIISSPNPVSTDAK